MKFTLGFLVGLVLVSSSAFATSPKTGPWIHYSIGTAGTDAPFAVCLVHGSSVTKNDGSGKKEVKQVQLNTAELKKAIQGAQRGQLQTSGLHVVATEPQVLITAGVFPGTPSFPLFRDASRIETRTGKDSADLIKQARLLCGKLEAK